MTREEREAAIAYIKGYRKLDEDLHNTAPKDSISYYATDKCLKYWDMAIKALSQEQKTGHWIITCKIRAIGSSIKTCSICNKQALEISKYCPNCGAKMVETQEGSEKE